MQPPAIRQGKQMRTLVAVGLYAATAAGGYAQAQAADMDISKVPRPVLDAIKKYLPTAKWATADHETEDGQETFELSGADDKGRTLIVQALVDGKITAVRTAVPLTEVPKTAWKGVAQKVPTLEAISAYELRQGDNLLDAGDADLTYEIGGVDEKERQIILEVFADGEISEMERELTSTDVPQAVLAALRGKLPTFETSRVFELSEDGEVVGYLFEGKRPKEKKAQEIDVFVSANGADVEPRE